MALTAVWQLTDGIDSPTGLALAKDGSVLVVDYAANRVHHISAAGVLEDDWGSSGHEDGQLAHGAGIAVDTDGFVYVADHDNYRVQKFDAQGTFLLAWGSKGEATGQFDGPDGIAVAPDGLVYVSEDDNARIQSFDTAGRFVREWRDPSGHAFGDPTGIAFRGDRLLVADYDASVVWLIDSDGTLVDTIGAPGELNGVSLIATNPAGHLFVTDYNGGHIQEYDAEGRNLTTYVLPDEARFSRPYGLAIGADGDLYVAEFGASRVERLRPP